MVHDELEGVITGQAASQAEDSAATASGARRAILVVVVLALLAALALASLVTRSVTRPVAVLVERLRSLDERCLASLRAGLAGLSRGDLTVEAEPGTEPIADPGRDEVGVASVTLNDLIAKTHESLAAYNASRAQLGEMVGQACRAPRSRCRPPRRRWPRRPTRPGARSARSPRRSATSRTARSARCARWSRSRRRPRRWRRPAT